MLREHGTYCTWFEATRESVYCEAPTEDDSALVPRILSSMLHQPWNMLFSHMPHLKWYGVLFLFIEKKRNRCVSLYHWNSLHKERFMSQARRTPHFARSAKRAWSAGRRRRKKRRVLLTWLIKCLLCRLTLDGFEPIALPSFYYIVKSQKSPVSEHGKCHDNDLVVSFISSVCKGQLPLKSRNVLSVAWALE